MTTAATEPVRRPPRRRRARPPIELDPADFRPPINPVTGRRPDSNLRVFRPTPAQRVMVSALAACNVHYAGISAYIRVNEEVMRRYFRDELANGYDKTEAALVGVLTAKALAGNMAALTTMLRCVFGWRENSKVTDGKATLEALTTDQRISLMDALRASLGPAKTGSGTRRKDKTDMVTVTGTTDESDC